MKVTVLIPVKSLDKAKSRLGKYLSDTDRKKLVLDMLGHVIQTVKQASPNFEIYIVTNDKTVESYGAQAGVTSLLNTIQGMNRSLTKATKDIPTDQPLLVISADLPLVTTIDIQKMVSVGEQYPVILAVAKEGTGTNAVLMTKPGNLEFQFGANSLQKFIHEAGMKGLKTHIYRSETAGFDIDTFSDYREYIKRKS